MNNPHLTQEVVYAGAAISADNPVILALHGRNQTTDFILATVARLGWEAASVVAPAAADNSWYPSGFMAPFADNEPYFSFALDRVEQLIASLADQGVQQRNLYLFGFSQGACLAAEYTIRHAGRYGGIAILTGGVIGPPGTTWQYGGSFAQTPTLITTGDQDEWVPLGRVEETIALFEQRDADVTSAVYAGRDHLVSDAEIALARERFLID